MIWALRDPLRFAAERRAMAELEARSDWLTVRTWRLLPGGDLGIEFDIQTGDETFDGCLAYPDAFPQVPPSLRPREERRWSRLHQYGDGGELCLEWGPDNWEPAITGADMVESVQRLLAAEEREVADSLPVPTRHAVTAGQALRGETHRFVATGVLEERLASLQNDSQATFSLRYRAGNLLTVLATLDDEPEWIDASIPQPILDVGFNMPGRVVLVPARPPGLTGQAGPLRTMLLGAPACEGAKDEILLCRAPDGELFASYLRHESDVALELGVVRAEPRQRLDAEHGRLDATSVGVVGCGSMGSKLATSLARSGVGRFVLVDDDVMRPSNLVRHDLDWNAVGRHKVDALSDRLKLINPQVTVDVRRHRLGGQESNAGLDATVTTLAGCDLVIDATADGRAFNYAAAAAAEGARAMLWAEIFGGGFGGLIARSRPGLDPEPHKARAAIEAWCREMGTTAPRPGNDYEGIGADRTMIADDTAVSTIAAHAAALAVDTLLGRAPSRFPVSAYMIGMQEEWIFTAPFDTWPIDLGSGTSAAPSYDPADPELKAALTDLGSIVGR